MMMDKLFSEFQPVQILENTETRKNFIHFSQQENLRSTINDDVFWRSKNSKTLMCILVFCFCFFDSFISYYKLLYKIVKQMNGWPRWLNSQRGPCLRELFADNCLYPHYHHFLSCSEISILYAEDSGSNNYLRFLGWVRRFLWSIRRWVDGTI